MITTHKVSTVIFEFRNDCLRKYQDVDLLNEKERGERLGIWLSEPSDYLLTGGNQPIDQLSRLIKVPRLLKTILRRVQQSWTSLHGEIDFDDLLVANAIRFAAPEAFDFLLENFRSIRALEYQGIGNENKERAEQLEAKWDVFKDAAWDRATVRQLITFLFPMWSSNSFGGRRVPPQGVSHSQPTDYWMRLLVGELGPDEIGDQETIQAIKRWAAGVGEHHFRKDTLAEALSKSTELAAKFEQFARFFLDGDQLRKLASSLFEIMVREHGVKTNNESAPGFKPLWRCAVRQPTALEKHKAWLVDELLRYLPQSIRFTSELFYYWGSNDESEAHGYANRIDVWTILVTKAKELYANDPQRFLRAVDPTFLATSYAFAALNSDPKRGGPGFNPKEWEWLAHLLLAAAKVDPEPMIPQISVFVNKEVMTMSGFVPHFAEDQARAFFGEEYDRMLKVLSHKVDLSKFSEEQKRFIETAQEGARERFKK